MINEEQNVILTTRAFFFCFVFLGVGLPFKGPLTFCCSKVLEIADNILVEHWKVRECHT